MSTTAPAAHAWGRASAIAFAVLAVAWFFLAAVPDVIDAPEHILETYADAGARARVLAGTVALVLAGGFLLTFLADVCTLLHVLDRGPLAVLGLLGGVVFAALLLVAGALFAVLPWLIGFDEVSSRVDPDLAAAVVQLGLLMLLVFAPIGATAMVLAISVVALRRGLLAPWLARAGFVVAGLLPLSVVGLPLALLAVWLVAAGLGLRSPAPIAEPEPDRR